MLYVKTVFFRVSGHAAYKFSNRDPDFVALNIHFSEFFMSNRLNTSLIFFAAVMACTPYVNAAPFAYVPNEGSGTVTVIDTETDQIVSEIPAGKKPRGLAASNDKRWLYVSDQPNNRLQLIDLLERKPDGYVDLGDSPEGVSISPDGRWVAAAVEETNEVAITDTKTNKLVFSVKVKGRNPEHAVFSPDGKLIFVSAEEGGAIDVIDFLQKKQIAQITVSCFAR